MECNVICYANTGFNAVNLPDGPDYLQDTTNPFNWNNYMGFDVVDHMQLDHIDIKVARTDETGYNFIHEVDYCAIVPSTKISAKYIAYYIVTGYEFVSSTTVRLNLVMDYLTTLGGAKNLTYLDGTTVRYNTPDDKLFEYTQQDELMTPAEPLELETEWYDDYEPGEKIFVESTIDLVALGAQFDADGNFTGAGMKFTDPTATVTSEKTIIYDSTGAETGSQITEHKPETIVVPYTQGVSAPTVYTGIDGVSVNAPYTRLFDSSAPNVRRALSAVRTLSAESSIISQVIYPESVSVAESSVGDVSAVSGSRQLVSTDLAFSKYGNKCNRALNCGQYNAVGMITVSGEKMEAYPEQIYNDSDSVGYVTVCDPRPDGKPYYRFDSYMGKKFGGIQDLMMGSVSGLQWTSAPLVYTAPSGSYLDKINYQTSAATAQLNYGSAQTGIENSLYYNQERNQNSVLGNIISSISGLAGSIKTGSTPDAGLYSMWSAQSSYEEGRTSNQNSLLKNELAYSVARQKELANYAISQSVVVPQVVVPFNANYLRDFGGNGLLIYRYNYSANDQARIDRLLTMYGYKVTAALTTEMFSTRKYFNYVQATGVSIGGSTRDNVPTAKFLRDGAAAQLSVGARFWHIKPTADCYKNGAANPIV